MSQSLCRTILAFAFAVSVQGVLASGFQQGHAGPDASILVLAARALEHGEGIAKDPARAAELYCQGARAGDAEAQFSLGWMHANARGVPRDDALAAYFFRLAAEQGHDHAKRMLRFTGETIACRIDA